MKKRNVLIFPAGTEIGLEIFNSLRYCKEVNLFGAGQDVPNHARFIYEDYHVISSIYENTWIDELATLCNRLEIDYIFPAYDDIIVALSQNDKKIPAKIISSPRYTCEITRSKSTTYGLLKNKIRTPVVYSDANQVTNFPVFVKPDKGQGSFGIFKASDSKTLINSIYSIPEPIICEYLPGEEYTIDCFSDREKGLLFCGARSRKRTRNGISVSSVTENIPETKEIAAKISSSLELHGAWFFQVKRSDDGELTLLEIAPRIAGSMATHRVQGINFALLSLFEAERLPISILAPYQHIEIDRALCNKYKHEVKFSTLYIDLDDTIILNDKINIMAMSLIFKCLNEKKDVILITKHQKNIEETLEAYKISSLFTEIIHIKKEEKKSSYIKNNESIFVDDSYSERLDVYTICGIQTFDCSMIEVLL